MGRTSDDPSRVVGEVVRAAPGRGLCSSAPLRDEPARVHVLANESTCPGSRGHLWLTRMIQ